MSLADKSGRTINYLRLSVTDRCNMRCSYCMPEDGIDKVAHSEILNYEDFLLIARAALKLGLEKIRVTGGEPLVRKGLLDFLQRLSSLPGLTQLVLTTNGAKLGAMAQGLKDAGVERLNISLDSLDADTFSKLTRRDLLKEVLKGLDEADRVGLPYKINTVLIRGWNDHEILDFTEMAKERRCTVRFIEYMPVLKEPGWPSQVVPSAEILERLQNHYDLQPLTRDVVAGPAQEYRLGHSDGFVGVISPMTGHFCNECNRIRVTSSGQVRTCLFSERESDLKPLLQTNDADLLAEAMAQLIQQKPVCHNVTSSETDYAAFTMAGIGG